jgi:hypothetical protein
MVDFDQEKIKPLDTVNDFPHVGLLYFENSGENLLRFYLENIFKIQTDSNIISSSQNLIYPKKNQDLNLSWIIASDYPTRSKYEYEQVEILLGIILVRNPIEVIMSLLLRDSFFLEEALDKADEYINNWKYFYKYWKKAPIPCYIVKYEELLEKPELILKDLCRFILGIKTIEDTKLDDSIQKTLMIPIEDKYYAFDVTTKQSVNLSDNILSQFQEKFNIVRGLMKKFNYAGYLKEEKDFQSNDSFYKKNEEYDNDNYESNFQIPQILTKIDIIKSTNWINEFNNGNIIKSVELHDSLSNNMLISSYFTIRLS